MPSLRTVAIFLIAVIPLLAGCTPLIQIDAGSLLNASTPAIKSDKPLGNPDAQIDGWIRDDAEQRPPYRWRNSVVPEPPKSAAALKEWRSKYADDKLHAATATILLARQSTPTSVHDLVEIANDPHRSNRTRRAAIETIALSKHKKTRPQLEALLKYYGDQQYAPQQYDGELHAELIDAWARHTTPSTDPFIIRGLESKSPLVRLAALDRIAEDPHHELPFEAVELIADNSDPRVQTAAIRLVGIKGCDEPEVHDEIKRMAFGKNLEQRLVAIEALGNLGTSHLTDLRRLLKEGSGKVQAEAARALIRLGDYDTVYRLAYDKDEKNRYAAAAALERDPGRRGRSLALYLADDERQGIQLRAVESVAGWPPHRAIPILLKVAQDHPRQRVAFRSLEHLQVILGTRARRVTSISYERVLAKMERMWMSDHGNSVEVADPAVVIHDVEAALGFLASRSFQTRRRAARQLRKRTKEKGLSLTQIDHVAKLMSREVDPVVWSDVLMALDGQSIGVIEPIILSAVSQGTEGRVALCDFVERNRTVSLLDQVSEFLGDPAMEVRLAALKTLASARARSYAPIVERGLKAPDPHERLAVAVTLAKMGSSRGRSVLERLYHYPDPKVRALTVAAMGELGNPLYRDFIRRALRDPATKRAATEALQRLNE